MLYDLGNEDLPAAPIYDQKLQKALADAIQNLAQLCNTMGKTPRLMAPNLAMLAQQTRQLVDFDYPRTRTIGFVGESGVGELQNFN